MYDDQVDFYIIYTLEAHPISGRPMEYSYDAEGNRTACCSIGSWNDSGTSQEL